MRTKTSKSSEMPRALSAQAFLSSATLGLVYTIFSIIIASFASRVTQRLVYITVMSKTSGGGTDLRTQIL